MNKKLLNHCLTIAQSKNNAENHSEYGQGFVHFSFIIQNNKILSMGKNKRATPLLCYPKHANIHAENDAFFKAQGIIDYNKKWECVNIRLNRQGIMRGSAPCQYCNLWLTKLGVSGFYYTTDNGFVKTVK